MDRFDRLDRFGSIEVEGGRQARLIHRGAEGARAAATIERWDGHGAPQSIDGLALDQGAVSIDWGRR